LYTVNFGVDISFRRIAVQAASPTGHPQKYANYVAGEVGNSSAEEDESVVEELVPSAEFSHDMGDTVSTIYHINDSCKLPVTIVMLCCSQF
jgi:hypothetical protein